MPPKKTESARSPHYNTGDKNIDAFFGSETTAQNKEAFHTEGQMEQQTDSRQGYLTRGIVFTPSPYIYGVFLHRHPILS